MEPVFELYVPAKQLVHVSPSEPYVPAGHISQRANKVCDSVIFTVVVLVIFVPPVFAVYHPKNL